VPRWPVRRGAGRAVVERVNPPSGVRMSLAPSSAWPCHPTVPSRCPVAHAGVVRTFGCGPPAVAVTQRQGTSTAGTSAALPSRSAILCKGCEQAPRRGGQIRRAAGHLGRVGILLRPNTLSPPRRARGAALRAAEDTAARTLFAGTTSPALQSPPFSTAARAAALASARGLVIVGNVLAAVSPDAVRSAPRAGPPDAPLSR
jgi:hypothetical protein